MYNIDYNKLILWLLPDFKRKPKQYAWLRVLTSPSVKLSEEFLKRREEHLYRLNHNGQVFSLQKVLNDRFDTRQRRIYITDGYSNDRLFIHTKDEDKPRQLGILYLHNRADYADTGVDFIAWVPNSVPLTTSDTYELRSLIDFYKLASKRYTIYRT